MMATPRWECFFCEDGFHLKPGICGCGVERRRVPMLVEGAVA